MTEARIKEILAQLTPRIIGHELAKGACGCSGCTTGPSVAVSVLPPQDAEDRAHWFNWSVQVKSTDPAFAALPATGSVGLSYFVPADELTAIFADPPGSSVAINDDGSQPSA